jgi:N-acetyl-gamma-glutamyl-phosphate reductase
MRQRIGIVGARGFAGAELLRLGLRHPQCEITYVTSESQAGQPLDAAFPTLHGATRLHFSAFDASEAAAAADAFFFALPDGEAMKAAPALLEQGKKVVDLSGDFRVRDTASYERWYGREHLSPHLLSEAVYGMPELHPEVREARLVANPGCYPTAMLLALSPLFASRRIDPDSVIVDAKSGVSGAGGRVGMKEEFSFPAVNENLRAYSVTGHRHLAETEQELAAIAGRATEEVRLSFTPHLLPITRGLYVTAYATLRGTVDLDSLIQEHRAFFRDAPFVHVAGSAIPEVRHVIGSNVCRIGMALDERVGRVIVMAVIDNLVKGAAGQAIQNMNLMLGLPEAAGLEAPAIYP